MGGMELVRLYVHKASRRQSLATRLLRLVEEAAHERNFSINLWTDTRFAEAHQFYSAHGFEQLPGTRFLNDPSNTSEYQFLRPAR